MTSSSYREHSKRWGRVTSNSAEVRVESHLDVISGFESEQVARLRNVHLTVVDVARLESIWTISARSWIV